MGRLGRRLAELACFNSHGDDPSLDDAHLAHSALRRYARPAENAPAEARPVTALFAAFTPK